MNKFSHIAEGITLFEGKEDNNERLIISGSIHGDERVGGEIIESLYKDITSGSLELKGKLLLILGSPESYKINKHFVDEDNLNWFFRGHNRGESYEGIRANAIMSATDSFVRSYGKPTMVIDMHQTFYGNIIDSTDPYSCQAYGIFYTSEFQKQTKQISDILNLGIRNIVLIDKADDHPNGTFSGFITSKYGSPTWVLELGAAGSPLPGCLSKFPTRLRELISSNSSSQLTRDALDKLRIFKRRIQIPRSSSIELLYDYLDLEPIPEGEVMAYVRGGEEYIAKKGDHALFRTSTNKLLPLMEVVQLIDHKKFM